MILALLVLVTTHIAKRQEGQRRTEEIFDFFHGIVYDSGGQSTRQIFTKPAAHPIENIPKLSQEESSWLEYT